MFVEALEFLNAQVQSLNFLVLVHDLLFEVAFLVHHFFEGDVLFLHQIVVGNVSQRGLRSLILIVLLMHGNLVSHVCNVSLMNHFILIDSVLVVSTQVDLLLNSISEFLSEVIEHVSQIIGFSVVSSYAVP